MGTDTDIDFMDYESARDYVLNFITTLKKTQKERSSVQEELYLWQNRAGLAEERLEPLLKKGAEERVAELEAKSGLLLQEEEDLTRKISILREKLKVIKIRPALSVDTLLGQTEMDSEDLLDKQIKEEEAKQALDALKKKIEQEGE